MERISTDMLVVMVEDSIVSFENTVVTISCDHVGCNAEATFEEHGGIPISVAAIGWGMLLDWHYCPEHRHLYLTPED